MAKRYLQHDNGLLLPEWFPSRDRVRPTRDRHFIFTPGGGPCRCCVHHYYVDSASGNQAETGSGTEEDPWINLNTPFNNVVGQGRNIHDDIGERRCKVTVWVKGTIDYCVEGYWDTYEKLLFIKPWDIDRITCRFTYTSSRRAVIISIAGCNWYNTDCIGIADSVDDDITGHGYGFSNCLYSTFTNCTGTGAGTSVDYKLGYGYGFYDCYGSTFTNCTGIGTVSGPVHGHGHGYGFWQCYSSTFINCTGTGTVSATDYGDNYGYGFYYCYSSTFTNCTGTGTGYSIGYGYSISYGYGFFYCISSTFEQCSGLCQSSDDGCGFKNCTSGSYFDGCTTTDCSDSGCDEVS